MEDRPAAQLGELFEYLGPGLLEREHCPPWPPDVFALTASVLRRTGAYVRVLDLHPSDSPSKGWVEQVLRLAERWRRALNESLAKRDSLGLDEEGSLPSVKAPVKLDAAWKLIQGHAETPLAEIPDNDRLCRALLLLCLVADQTSAGIGIDVRDQDLFLEYAAWEVLPQNNLTSLCLEIDPERVRVLPKQHTSQRGITVRSLSHHLALCPATEVEVSWNGPYATSEEKDPDVLNLLLIPWPLQLTAKDFQLCSPADLPSPAEPYRLFSFQRKPKGDPSIELRSFLEMALDTALEYVEHVDGIVFPELALSHKELRAAERIALQKDALLIAGVNCKAGEEDFIAPTNACFVQPVGFTRLKDIAIAKDLFDLLRIRQAKHHRWCLDRNQIIQYGLGGVLPASKDCWEVTDVRQRSLNFVTFGSWLTLSVLICEDLARQDPVAEILRSVGPNLVIALLMDGPQLRNRWPSRYASVLADDPGSSVLTLTSLGMSCRSRPASSNEPDRSRTIALWRDICYGEREIELPKEDNACVLSLVCKSLEEFSADGRGDGGKSNFPVFAGVHTFQVPTETLAPK